MHNSKEYVTYSIAQRKINGNITNITCLETQAACTCQAELAPTLDLHHNIENYSPATIAKCVNNEVK